MNARSKIHPEIQTEPLSTRVALHPLLAGMNHSQLTLLTDCAVARHFERDQLILREGEFANGFYLIETGKVALESTQLWRIDPVTGNWRRGFARLVVDVSAVRLAIYGSGGRADYGAFFLRGDSARVLRKGPLIRLRTSKTDERRNGDTPAGFARSNGGPAF
jgi:hypothetical protein